MLSSLPLCGYAQAQTTQHDVKPDSGYITNGSDFYIGISVRPSHRLTESISEKNRHGSFTQISHPGSVSQTQLPAARKPARTQHRDDEVLRFRINQRVQWTRKFRRGREDHLNISKESNGKGTDGMY